MKIGILIDSTSTFDSGELKQNNINIIHNLVNNVNGQAYVDECTDEQKLSVCNQINDGVIFKTSLINYEIILSTIQEMLVNYERVIFLCIGPGFSGQYQNGLNVAKTIGNDKLMVLHTNSTACQSEMVLEWLLNKLKNNNCDDIWNQEKLQQEIINLSNHMTTMFTTNNYQGFLNTGRVPSIVAKTLKLTKMYPVICAEEVNERERFYRKWDHAIENVFDAIDKRFNKAPRENDIKELYICHSLCDQSFISKLKEKVAQHFAFNINKIKIRVTPLCVLITTLLGSFGIAIWTTDNIFKKHSFKRNH